MFTKNVLVRRIIDVRQTIMKRKALTSQSDKEIDVLTKTLLLDCHTNNVFVSHIIDALRVLIKRKSTD